MKKKKDTGVQVEEKKDSFFKKMKNDKKYNAKVQLIGYGVLVVVLILYLNIANMGNHYSASNSVLSGTDSALDSNSEGENTSIESSNLLKKIHDNYRYDISVKVVFKNDGIEENREIRYYGKAYGNQLEISREEQDESSFFYKVDSRYYQDNEGLRLVGEEDIYSLIGKEYLELDSILELLDKASLDHVTDYSSGKKEYVYHLLVKDVIVSYQKDDIIEINIIQEDDTLTMKIDYTNLLKVENQEMVSGMVEASYSEIGKIEKFNVIENEENTSQ